MTRRAGAPARGTPWWMDMDPPGVGGNPVLIDLPDDEPSLSDYIALDEGISENHTISDFREDHRTTSHGCHDDR